MNTETPVPVLPFTGERFTPECVREIWYEHWHRYAFAAPIARGRRVLDAACGEGYGSALLAQHGAEVLGVDISAEAIGHARRRYSVIPGLRFQTMDVTALELPEASFDLVVSFETLEHLAEHDALLQGFRRVLKPDGLLLISSPDKATYSDASGHVNPFHVRELYRAEFEALLRRHFPAYRLYGQKLLFQSVLWPVDGQAGPAQASALSVGSLALRPGIPQAPIYFLAVAALDPARLGGLPGLSLFGDPEESVYQHYNHEIRKNMQAGAILQERQQRIEALEAELAQLRGLNPSA